MGAAAYLTTPKGALTATMALWTAGSLVAVGILGRRLMRLLRQTRRMGAAPEWLAREVSLVSQALGVRRRA